MKVNVKVTLYGVPKSFVGAFLRRVAKDITAHSTGAEDGTIGRLVDDDMGNTIGEWSLENDK